jgi:MscS family membrane protein
MEKFLNYTILDNSVQSYLYVFGTILFVLLIKRLVSKFLAGKLLGVIISGDKKSIRKERFLQMVVKPIETFLISLIAITALDRLYYPEVLKFKIFHISADAVVHATAVIIIVVVFIRLCIRIMMFVAMIMEEKASSTHDKSDNQLIVFFRDFFKVILIIIGILLILHFAFNKDIGNLFTGLSVVAAAMALAARESLENLIASFIIFFDKPFITGDTVKVLNITGTVEKIGLRSTRIRTDQKTFVTVPNKQMVDTVMDNITLRSQRKVELRLELSLSATVVQLQKLSIDIANILTSKSLVENNHVYLMDTGKNAHIMAVDYFTAMEQTIEEFYDFRQIINLEIIDLLNRSNVQYAAASTDIIVTQKN